MPLALIDSGLIAIEFSNKLAKGSIVLDALDYDLFRLLFDLFLFLNDLRGVVLVRRRRIFGLGAFARIHRFVGWFHLI